MVIEIAPPFVHPMKQIQSVWFHKDFVSSLEWSSYLNFLEIDKSIVVYFSNTIDLITENCINT